MSKPAKPANDADQPACGGPTPGPSLSERGNPEDDAEIAALLGFEPVPRAYKQRGAWTPELQRLFIARLAVRGSVNKACDDLGKDAGGIRRLRKAPGSESFRASWDAAEELWERRNPAPPPEPFGAGERKRRTGPPPGPSTGSGQGQVLNEFGEWEDEESMHRRAEEARDSIGRKLVQCRRLYLQQISGNAGKRAAFEILSELAVDWERAERLQPQPFEPWIGTNQRQPDMVLTAESGWTAGEFGYGPDRKAEARRTVDAYRAKKKLPPIDWDAKEKTDDAETEGRHGVNP